MVFLSTKDSPEGSQRKTMTPNNHNAKRKDWKEEIRELLRQDADLLKGLVEEVVEQVLEAEMEEALGAAKGERTPNRLGYRSGY